MHSNVVRIIMIEDDIEFEQLIRMMLKKSSSPFELYRFETEEQTRKALNDGEWHMALVDLKMPEWDGFSATNLINTLAPQIPILVLSANLDESTMKRLTDAGALDCIPKNQLYRLPGALDRAISESDERARRQTAESSLKKTEALLRQSQKLETIGALAGGIAHDFNNLLSVILMQCEVSLEKSSDSDPLRPQIAQIQKTAQRAARLTKQLLAFSRHQVMQPKVVDVNALLNDMTEMFDRILGENIRVESNLEENLKSVFIEPSLLEQVTLNLVINARDAMPRGGVIQVTTETLTIEKATFNSKPGDYVVITVKDNGIGMNQETQLRMFEPFFTTKDKATGTGLGLATVYGIVSQCGGFINVSSALGVGTSIQVHLPASSELPTQVDTPKTYFQKAQETILLVEDEEDLRDIVASVLTDKGYKVLVAKDFDEGVKQATLHRDSIQLLLTDVLLSQGDGCMLANEVNKIIPELPVLYMSGYLDDTMDRLGMNKNEQTMIEKPFTITKLLEKLRHVLEVEDVQKNLTV